MEVGTRKWECTGEHGGRRSLATLHFSVPKSHPSPLVPRPSSLTPSMKSIAILILGCLPLAVLTVWSFVELGSIQSQLELETRNEGPPTRTLAPSPSSLAPFVEELAETDLLSGEPPAGLENLPEESSFAPVKDTWPKWTVARQMVGEFLEVERLTLATAPEPFEQAPLEDLDIAGERLAQFERTCELSKQKYQELKQDFQNSPSGGSPAPSGTGPLIALVDGRIAELDRRLDQCRKRLKAAELLAGARAAFQPQQYGECVELCDKPLSPATPRCWPRRRPRR